MKCPGLPMVPCRSSTQKQFYDNDATVVCTSSTLEMTLTLGDMHLANHTSYNSRKSKFCIFS
eukprot:m.405012 g.405012  ORF g.405012 m.405012 type:complete len:62 (-) comp21203_c0_seq7:178-363(-)